jgi:hypothetical protein
MQEEEQTALGDNVDPKSKLPEYKLLSFNSQIFFILNFKKAPVLMCKQNS